MKDYCLGFAFTVDRSKVILIHKHKPEWQRGKFNGVGGSIEKGETPEEAMIREFDEEVGMLLDWEPFGIISHPEHGGIVWLYRAFTDRVYEYQQPTIEEVHLIKTSNAHNYPLIDNLRFLIPLCLQKERMFVTVLYRD